MCVCVSLCACMNLCDWVSRSPSHSTQHVPPFSLSTPPPFTFTPSSFRSSLHLLLFMLTVIWQAQGWQTWTWQGKRLSGLALLGSCWLAEESAVRSGSCDRPGDWCGGRQGWQGRAVAELMQWNGIEGYWKGPEGCFWRWVCSASSAQPKMCYLFDYDSAILQTDLRSHTSAFTQITTPSVIKLHRHAASNRYFQTLCSSDCIFEPRRIEKILSNQA